LRARGIMKVKRPNAKCSDLKARLKAGQRAIEARMRRNAPRGAAFLQKIENLDLRNVRSRRRARTLKHLQSRYFSTTSFPIIPSRTGFSATDHEVVPRREAFVRAKRFSQVLQSQLALRPSNHCVTA
jgi:hypothetical protein